MREERKELASPAGRPTLRSFNAHEIIADIEQREGLCRGLLGMRITAPFRGKDIDCQVVRVDSAPDGGKEPTAYYRPSGLGQIPPRDDSQSQYFASMRIDDARKLVRIRQEEESQIPTNLCDSPLHPGVSEAAQAAAAAAFQSPTNLALPAETEYTGPAQDAGIEEEAQEQPEPGELVRTDRRRRGRSEARKKK